MKYFVFYCLFFSLILANCAPQNPSGSLNLPRKKFRPGETVTIKYKVDGRLGNDAWVGIVPDNLPHDELSVAEQQRLASQPLTRTGQGELTFTVPREAGEYDFRIYTGNERDIEVASDKFSVEAP